MTTGVTLLIVTSIIFIFIAIAWIAGQVKREEEGKKSDHSSKEK